MLSRYAIVFLLPLWFASCATAQNVTGYGAMDDPLLFLLREPAVHVDLGLSSAQRQKLIEHNESMDKTFLQSRNSRWRQEAAAKQAREVATAAKTAAEEILTKKQRDRLKQISYRLKGITFILDPDAVARLSLTADQVEKITSIIEETTEKTQGAYTRAFPGKEAHEKNQKLILSAQKQQQEDILAVLTNVQKRKLVGLVGKEFDANSLGRASFKAPEIVNSNDWINTEPIKLADLQGKVVVVHYFAFSCKNCIANYPWYRAWQEDFANRDDLEILGIHSPETKDERDPEKVRESVAKEEFGFPVLIDTGKKTWNKWGNTMWPAVYLIDKQGRIRYWWFGELNWNDAGGQDLMKRRIEELLAEGPERLTRN